MVLIDPRAGSGDLLDPIARRLNGQACHSMLESGDVAFEGNGPDGPINVGIELKTLSDMLTSMRTGRYIDQLDRMLMDYQVIYLFIEGVWRPDDEGLIEVPNHGSWRPLNTSTREQAKRGRGAYYTYAELDKFIISLEEKRDVVVCRVPRFPNSSRLETVTMLIDRYTWWQKPWDSHSSVEKIKIQSGNLMAGKATVLRRVAAQLPECAWETSLHIERHFGTVEALSAATEEELAQVKWKTAKGRNGRISPRLAGVIYNALRSKS